MPNSLLTEDGGHLLTEDGGRILLDQLPGHKLIKDEIVATLQTLTPDSLTVVYGKEEKVLASYPAACVSANNFQSQAQTMGSIPGGSNKETYQFFIRLYFRTDEKNDPDYEDVLEGVADEVLAALRHNIQLNGTCSFSIPSSGNWKFGTKETPERVFEIIETATVFNTR